MKQKQDKYLPSVIILMSLFLVGVYFISDSQSKEIKIEPVNYKALFQAGLAPTAQPRIKTSVDIDTGLRINYQGQVLALYESRNWNTLDYGKTFLVRIK